MSLSFSHISPPPPMHFFHRLIMSFFKQKSWRSEHPHTTSWFLSCALCWVRHLSTLLPSSSVNELVVTEKDTWWLRWWHTILHTVPHCQLTECSWRCQETGAVTNLHFTEEETETCKWNVLLRITLLVGGRIRKLVGSSPGRESRAETGGCHDTLSQQVEWQ